MNPFQARFTLDYFPAVVIAACILFNFFLCFVNTNIFGISNPIIMGCEGILMAAAVIYSFNRLDKFKLFWITIIVLQIALVVILSMVKHEVLLKPLRDILIMPVFLCLGLSAFKMDVPKPLLYFMGFVLFIAYCEGFQTAPYLDIFNIKDYFIAKGAMEDLDYLNLDVFASGERPTGRFLFQVEGLHRVSSVFLEPVSLGFFAFITGLYFVADKPNMPLKYYYIGLFLSVVLIWFSDGRMALGSLIVMLLLKPVFLRIDHRFAALIFPLMYFLSLLANRMELFALEGDGLGPRINTTMHLLDIMHLDAYLGLANMYGIFLGDSGLASLLGPMGAFGVLLYWLPPIFFMKKIPGEARIFIFGASLYVAFGFMISAAIYTIKTAALLWFLYGYLIAKHMRNEDGTMTYSLPNIRD